VGWLLAACSTAEPGSRIDPREYAFLGNTRSREDIVWRKIEGPGFEAFYGNPSNSRTCGFGFYIGAVPNFHPAANAVVRKGSLGQFQVSWYETTDANPRQFHRETVIEYGLRTAQAGDRLTQYQQRIHVWIYGSTEDEVLRMVECLDDLQLFLHKPESP
jgi:hypothetical protein